jgi:hypothetical protein
MGYATLQALTKGGGAKGMWGARREGGGVRGERHFSYARHIFVQLFNMLANYMHKQNNVLDD